MSYDPKETGYRPFSDQGMTTWGNLEFLGPNHVSTIARYWLSRMFVAMSTFALLLAAWLEPESLVSELLTSSGPAGWRVAGLVCAICLLGMLDVVVNDLLPERWRLQPTKRNRHLIYLALAVGNVACCYVFVVESGGRYRGVVLPFALNTVYALAVAFLDLFQRHRAPQ